MSKTYSPTTTYHCINDCRQEGCPGHELRLIWDLSTDHVIEEIDGIEVEVYDEHRFMAILEVSGCSWR